MLPTVRIRKSNEILGHCVSQSVKAKSGSAPARSMLREQRRSYQHKIDSRQYADLFWDEA